jgi:predicted HAD superfamily phosphohydrolase YqeG
MSEFAAPAIPYLPPIRKDRKYTLILDLDETLIHYDIDE